MTRTAIVASLLSLALASQAWGQAAQHTAKSFTGMDYPARELLQTCQQADNDSRRGTQLEIECEQYVIGFLDALQEVGYLGDPGKGCPPTVNTADEARWAFVRWVHMKYSERSKIPAADAMLAMLPDMFPCQ